jgi:outer membrane protein assembly factor BamB
MSDMFSESFSFFALDATTGKLLWQHPAKKSIRHNAIAIGGGHVYLIDRELAKVDGINYRGAKKPKKGEKAEKATPHATGELIALDAKTGKVAWRMEDEVYGTTLALSVDESALLMSYQPTRFRLPSEVGGRLSVFHTKNGYRLWDKKVKYESRPLIIGKTVYAQGGAWDVKSGVERSFPFKRSYGCGILASGKNLFVFRSATMGYWDLTENREVRNYGGLRLGCWINAIPAGGLVLVPDGSAGCKCSYLNRASIALQSVD